MSQVKSQSLMTPQPSKLMGVGELTAMQVAMISRCAVVCSVMECPPSLETWRAKISVQIGKGVSCC